MQKRRNKNSRVACSCEMWVREIGSRTIVLVRVSHFSLMRRIKLNRYIWTVAFLCVEKPAEQWDGMVMGSAGWAGDSFLRFYLWRGSTDDASICMMVHDLKCPWTRRGVASGLSPRRWNISIHNQTVPFTHSQRNLGRPQTQSHEKCVSQYFFFLFRESYTN